MPTLFINFTVVQLQGSLDNRRPTFQTSEVPNVKQKPPEPWHPHRPRYSATQPRIVCLSPWCSPSDLVPGVICVLLNVPRLITGKPASHIPRVAFAMTAVMREASRFNQIVLTESYYILFLFPFILFRFPRVHLPQVILQDSLLTHASEPAAK